MEEGTSESGSDVVEVYVDPVEGQEDNNEERANMDENNESKDLKRNNVTKQMGRCHWK